MEWITGYYRQRKENLSLLLQQCREEDLSVWLCCICGGGRKEAGTQGSRLTEFLYGFYGKEQEKGWKRFWGKGDRSLNRLERCLRSWCSRQSWEEGFWAAGGMAVGEKLLLFQYGEAKLYHCNRGFQGSCLQGVSLEGESCCGWHIRQGRVEPEAGILFASPAFGSIFSEKEVEECLAVKEIGTLQQAQRRVQELGKAAEQRGAEDGAAVFAAACTRDITANCWNALEG